MASRSTSLTFDLYAKDKTASRTFDRFGRNVDDADSKVRKMGSTFATVGKTAAAGLAIGVAAAGVALVSFGKSAVGEAREAQKVAGQTEAVIKSTGGAAKVTADEVANLANQLSLKAGIDDEAIQSGENLLLTFMNIRNEVGKGNDIFNRATATALDMSVALGKDMKSASILVGKALNDPITGLTSLGRVGIVFSEQQKKVIERLVESGNTLKAQKIILGELDKKFAGSAAAQATAGEKAKVAWENFQESIGTKLLPLLDKLAIFFVEQVIPALQRFSAWFQREAIPVIKRFAAEALPVIKRFSALIVEGIKRVVAFVEENWPAIRETIVAEIDFIVAYIRVEVAVIKKIWDKWGEDIFAVVKIVFESIVGQIQAVLKIIRGIFHVFTGLLRGDWGLVWQGLQEIFGGFWDSLKMNLKLQFKLFGKLFQIGWDAVKDIAKKAWQGIKALLGLAWEGIKLYYGTQFKLLKGAFEKAWGAIRDLTKKAWGGIKNQVTDAWSDIKDAVGNALGWLKERVSDVWSAITGVFRSAGKNIFKIFRNMLADILDKFFDFVGTFLDLADRAFGWIPGVGDKLDAAKAAFNDFRNEVNDAIRGIDGSKTVKLDVIPGKRFQALVDSGAGHPAWTGNRATGGPITQGPAGKDWGAYALMRGEHVWTTSEVDKAGGHEAMYALRDMAESGALKQLVGMAKGGPVGVTPKLTGTKKALAYVRDSVGQFKNVLSQLRMLVPELATGGIKAALAWARKQVGDTYRLGAVGPNQWDCSGFMSGITNFLRGDPLHQRLGSTATFPWPGFARGADPGGFTIGSTPHYPGSSFGHMAGTLGGVNVESSGGVGVRVGRGARGYNDPGFTQVYHLVSSQIKSRGRGGDTGALSKAEKFIIRAEAGSLNNVNANNPISSAFGLGQLLEANRVKYARRLGYNWGIERGDTGSTDKARQIAMMRAYIRDRYGTDERAAAFERSHGWYGKGLHGGIFTKPTLIGVGERGPERVDVTPLNRPHGGAPMRAVIEVDGQQLAAVFRVIADEQIHDELKHMHGGM